MICIEQWESSDEASTLINALQSMGMSIQLKNSNWELSVYHIHQSTEKLKLQKSQP